MILNLTVRAVLGHVGNGVSHCGGSASLSLTAREMWGKQC